MGFNGMPNGWQGRENNGAYCGFKGGTFGYNMKGLCRLVWMSCERSSMLEIAHGNPLSSRCQVNRNLKAVYPKDILMPREALTPSNHTSYFLVFTNNVSM